MNWQGFLAMNGYGTYVWGSFGISFALLAGEVVALRRRTLRLRGLRGPALRRDDAGVAPFKTPLPGAAL